MYVSEIRELADSLLYHINELEAAREVWLANERIVVSEAEARPHKFSADRFNEALRQTGHQQTTIFEVFELVLAAWARLSLLFFPVRRRGEEGAWRAKRGDILKELLAVPTGSLIGNRSFRDSWMHFDERLDRAFIDGWLGNRQYFTISAKVQTAVQHTVRVIDVEGLAFHFRNEDGAVESVSIQDLKACLQRLRAERPNVRSRLSALPMPS